MIIAVVISGVISLVGELVFRMFLRGGIRSSSDDRKGGGAIVVILIGVALVVVSWILAVVVRLSLSRSREYLADAGAVELTKNPDAMISALLKISGRADIEGVPSGIMDMCFENDPDDFADLFSTIPPSPSGCRPWSRRRAGGCPNCLPTHPPWPSGRTCPAWSRPAPPGASRAADPASRPDAIKFDI